MSFFTALKPEIRKGTTRIVWVFPKLGFALKFPRIMVVQLLKFLWKYKRQPGNILFYFRYAKEDTLVSAHMHLLLGLKSNWREFTFFLRNRRNGFLFPTYFSLFGLVNVTPLGGKIDDRVKPYRMFFKATDGEAGKDIHHFGDRQNFCIRKGRLCIWDYGGLKTQQILLRHFEKLNALTSEGVT